LPRLAFSKEGEEWEASGTPDGSLVVGIDCTQDDAILSAGKARELMNAVQQLRKSAGLDLKDVVEVFFHEEGNEIENVVANNLNFFTVKFKGAAPLPQKFAESWAVTLLSETVEIGGSKVEVSICKPCLSAKDDLNEKAKNVLSTLDVDAVSKDNVIKCNVDGIDFVLNENTDYWLSAIAKVKTLEEVKWFN